MAREAGLEITVDPTETPLRTFVEGWDDQLKAFEALVRADERDRAMRENAFVQAEREALIGLLKGIDKTGIKSADGWRETSLLALILTLAFSSPSEQGGKNENHD
jgi:hypothetical protein